MERVTKMCNQCSGYGFVSSCCGFEIDGNRCSSCGKFCSADFCCPDGYEEYKKGTKVEIFVCVYSNEYLKENLYNAKELEDCKTFKGTVINILDYDTVEVKVKNKILKLNTEDISSNW